MEITKREVFVSVCILSLMLVFGLLIQQAIRTAVTKANKKYETAVQIEDPATFKYAMSTNVGNAFVCGELKAVDPVCNEEIEGEWLWLCKIEERYTRHQRTVTHSDGKKTWTTIEYYWTWDEVHRDTWHSQKITFLNQEFDYGLINVSSQKHIKTDKHGNTRYVWYGITTVHKGTIYSKLANKTITPAELMEDKTIQEAYKDTIKSETVFLVLFWVLWVLLAGGMVFGFCYLENRWLE